MSGFYCFPWLFKVVAFAEDGWSVSLYVDALDRKHAVRRAGYMWRDHFGARPFRDAYVDEDHTPERIVKGRIVA